MNNQQNPGQENKQAAGKTPPKDKDIEVKSREGEDKSKKDDKSGSCGSCC